MSEHKYTLMHKDTPCAVVIFGDEGKIDGFKLTNPKYAPFLGNCDMQKFSRWWAMRAVPASRTLIRHVMQDAGILTQEEYLEKNLALSITDTYWVCPYDADITYDDVRFTNLPRHGAVRIPYHNATSYDMNASLGGKMEKYWDLSGNIPILVKESYHNFGQQAINEVFATRIHQMQGTSVPYVQYSASRTNDEVIVSKCPAFTSGNIELIPAYEVIESTKIRSDQNLYSSYIDIAAENGIDRDEMQTFMDYQTMTDFLISNTDEHLLNFGVLRDANSMRLLGPAPIFDSGNSMFYDENRNSPYSRVELLQREITSFYKTEEKMMANVRNKDVLHLDRIPTPNQVMEFFIQSGIPEEKARFISANYETKAVFLDEFQHGRKISLYQEKQNEKSAQHPHASSHSCSAIQRFIMIAGISGSGKHEKAKELMHEFENRGYRIIDSMLLYPAEQADTDYGIIADPYKAAAERTPQTDGKPTLCAVYISPNEIREERRNKGLPINDDLVFVAVFARIRQALLDGDSVIFSAVNLDADTRENVLRILPRSQNISKELIVCYSNPENADTDLPDAQIAAQANILSQNPPTKSEGWDTITVQGKELVRDDPSEVIFL